MNNEIALYNKRQSLTLNSPNHDGLYVYTPHLHSSKKNHAQLRPMENLVLRSLPPPPEAASADLGLAS